MRGYIDNPTNLGWLTSIMEIGSYLGVILLRFIAEVLSRKYGIFIATTVFLLGVIIQVTAKAQSYQVVLAGRFITGIGVGGFSMIVPLYNSEVAPPEVRGALVGLQQLAITFGIMMSYWINYVTQYIGKTDEDQSNAAWLIPICLQIAPGVILLVGMFFMPFSPRWLVHHGREEEARKVLASLRGLTEDDELVNIEFLEIKADSLFEKRSLAEKFANLQAQTAWNVFKLQFIPIGSVFKTKAMFKRVICGTVTMFFQQWSGINAILYYAPIIFLSLDSATTKQVCGRQELLVSLCSLL